MGDKPGVVKSTYCESCAVLRYCFKTLRHFRVIVLFPEVLTCILAFSRMLITLSWSGCSIAMLCGAARPITYVHQQQYSQHSLMQSFVGHMSIPESGMQSHVFSNSNALSEQLQQFCTRSHRHAVLQTENSESTSCNTTCFQCSGRFTGRQTQATLICWDIYDSWGRSHG